MGQVWSLTGANVFYYPGSSNLAAPQLASGLLFAQARAEDSQVPLVSTGELLLWGAQSTAFQ